MKNFNNRVLLGLFTILGSILLILTISYIAFIDIVKKETYSSLTKDINLVIEEIDTLLKNNSNISFDIQNIPIFETINKNIPLDMVELSSLRNEIRHIVDTYDKYVNNVIVYPRASDYLLTLSGTYPKKTFFETYYSNSKYTYDFWQNQFNADYSTKYFESSVFAPQTIIPSGEPQRLAPIVSKVRYSSTYLIIVLIDEKELRMSLDYPFTDTLVAVSAQGTILSSNFTGDQLTYADLNDALDSKTAAILEDNSDGYTYIRKSLETDVIYSDYVSSAILNEKLFTTYSIPFLLTILAFFVGLLMAFLISKYISRPIQDLKALFEKISVDDNHRESDIDFIRTGVDSILSQNNLYSKEIEEKRNQILEFVYMSKFKNLYQQDGDRGNESEAEVDSTYVLVYVKVHNDGFNAIADLKAEIKAYFKDKLQLKYILVMGNDEIVLNIDGSKNDHFRAGREGHNVLSDFFVHEKQNLCITLVCGNAYQQQDFSATLYTDLVKCSKYTFLTDTTQFLHVSDKVYKKGVFQYFTSDERKKLYYHIFRSEKDEILTMIITLLNNNRENNVKNYYLQLACYRMINSCLNAMQDANNGISFNIDLESLMYKVANLYYFDDYIAVMSELVEIVIDNVPNTVKEQEDAIILKIKNYVQKNYQKNFSTEQLADDISISRSYISTYFKEKTNVNLSTYINNYRIMKSLKLLKETNMTIQDICDAVGIFNVNTFIRLFKKYMNTTPGNYRRDI